MHPSALFVLEKLESAGHQARLAGGCVRDLLLGNKPKDYDVATTAHPEQVLSLFEKTIPTGLSHGTITVMVDSEPIEVTTLRRDVETDGRHATVSFSNSFEEDSLRRDFTINAMYQDRHGVIYDFHNGRQHLAEKRLLFVGSAEQRIREDYLRILRFFRFLARFRFTSDMDTIETIYQLQSGLEHISRERINSELIQILNQENSSKIVRWMHDSGALLTVFGRFGRKGLSKEFFDYLDKFDSVPVEYRAITKLGYYLGIMTIEHAELFLKDSKLSIEQRNLLVMMTVFQYQRELFTADVNNKVKILELFDKFTKKIGDDAFRRAVLPLWAVLAVKGGLTSRVMRQGWPSVEAYLDHIVTLDEESRRKDPMPLNGNDLMAWGVKAGPNLGETIKLMRDAFWEERWTTREEGEAFFRSLKGTID